MSEIKFKEPCGGCGQEYASKRCFGCHHEAIDWNRRAPLSALLEEAEVVAWRHMLTVDLNSDTEISASSEHPFGKPGRDFAQSASVKSEPLVTLASLQAMQARAEAAERERDEMVETANTYAHQAAKAEIALRDGKARVKELEEALEPFAEAAGVFAREYPAMLDKPATSCGIRFDALQAARTALKGGSNG